MIARLTKARLVESTPHLHGESGPASGSAPDERLTERIVERALHAGARVSPVERAASRGLVEASGIAAALRC